MATITNELAHLTGAAVTGAYIVWAVLERVVLITKERHLTSLAAWASPVVALALLPAFFVFKKQHHFLRGTRINGCGFAKVYPHKDPIMGFDMVGKLLKAIKGNNLLEVWDDLFKVLGSTYWSMATGKWLVMTMDPENVKAILGTDFESWELGGIRKQTAIQSLGPHAIFSVNGGEWHHARAMIRPSFVRNQIADLECTDRHVDKFLARLPRDGSKFDMQQLFYLFTMDVSTDFMFGYSTNTLTSPTKESLEFTTAFDYVLLTSSSRARLGWLLMLLPDKKFSAYTKTIHTFMDRHVAEALSQNIEKERPYIFLNEIIKSGASHREVRDQLLSLILGGRDTSAATMSALFWMLGRRPDVVRLLRNEISELGGRKPTWDDLKNLKYLNMVLKEALRLWSPVATNSRTCTKDVILPKGGGPDGQKPIFLPNGTDCRYSLYSLHRSKALYGPDAEEFRPERWESIRPSWDYIPFSGGPRICIGQQFALTQMLYLIARVFQEFDMVEKADDAPMLHKVSTTVSLVNGCWVRLTPI